MVNQYTRQAGGYSVITSPGERSVEHDITKCAHCQSIIFLKAMCKPEDAPNFCMNCFAPVCKRHECKECVPFLKKIEEEERKALRGY